MISPPADKPAFWRTVETRRNAVFYWWLAWIPVNVALAALYRRVVHHDADTPTMWFALLGWGVGSLLLTYRLVKLPCPHCRQPAIQHIFFRMRNARCQHCGLKPGA